MSAPATPRWVRAYRADPVHACPGVGQQKPEAAELTQLRREVARLKMERDILKKAAVSSTDECNTGIRHSSEVLECRSSVER